MKQFCLPVALLVPLSVLLTSFPLSVAGDCTRLVGSGWDSCKAYKRGWVEIYEETDFKGEKRRLCCDPHDDSIESRRKQTRDTCMETSCISVSEAGSSSNLCPTLRVHGGEMVEMEEALRDHCDTKDKESGFEVQCCPTNSTEGYLLATLGAEMNEFPHIAGLNLDGACGGTVYNKRFILTAAHCVVDAETYQVGDTSKWIVVLGSNIRGELHASESNHYKVVKAIPHPNYSKLEGSLAFDNTTTFNDVALLKLDREIVFGETVKALELAPKGFRPLKYADSAVIAGWGTTDTLKLSPHLQKANFIIREDEDCFSSNKNGPWSGDEGRMDQMLCVGGIVNRVWSPTVGGGDSGGPAVCRGADGYAVQCGVTSFGGDDDECVKYDNSSACPPSVYAEVEHFREWIIQQAGEQDPSTFFKYKLYGEEVAPGKYEHQVHITSSTGKSCGGTLLSKNTVVTAAQCVVKNKDGEFHDDIQVTSHIQDLNSKGRRSFGVDSIAVAKGFEGPSGETKGSKRSIAAYKDPKLQAKHGYTRILMTDAYHKHDLAVLKLDGDVEIPESSLPKLPASDEDPTGTATEISFPRNTTYGSRLMQREFKFVPTSSCQARLNRLSVIGVKTKVDDDLICAVETYSGGSRCWRELGGGLICPGQNGGQDILCGVQVFRLCEFSIPNGFINIVKHKRWIERAMK